MSERDRTINGYNLPLLDGVENVGMYDIPALKPCDVVPDDLIGFNEAKTTVSFDAGVHFFLDDYQFERVWRRPDVYVRTLGRFQCVLTPDFSLYRDIPLAQQLYNVYRSHLIGAYWQRMGLNVIPTLQWSWRRSFGFAFDGLPRGSAVAASALGAANDPVAEVLWAAGMREALRRLKPSLVLLYGRMPEHFDFGGINVICFSNKAIARLKWVDAERRAAEAERGQEAPRHCHRLASK